MKKTYITPALIAVKIESAQLMAISGNSDETTEDQYSNKYQGGLLWEDDNNEAE